MLFVPSAGEFGKFVASHPTTRPAGSFGATVTASNGSYGSYATVLSGGSNTDDSYGILLHFNSIANSLLLPAFVKIGLDAAGGTSFTDFIVDLLATDAGAYPTGVWYFFPVFIKAGTTIGAAADVGNGTPGTVLVSCTLLCQPRRPGLVRAGSKVTTFGQNGLNPPTGVAVVSGSLAEGAWTGIQASLSAPAPWFWQAGFNFNVHPAALCYHLDVGIGDASNKRLAIENQLVQSTASDTVYKPPNFSRGYCPAKAGDNLYARLQCSSTPDSGLEVMVYGVSG